VTPSEIEAFSKAINALFVACMLSGFLAAYLGNVAADLTRFLLSKVPAYRAWRHKCNRESRLEVAELLRLQRERRQ
jgi:hypothetical protein